MLWPESSIPSTFTVCSVTRYTGGESGESGRILNCHASPTQSVDWLHGHSSSRRGVAYYNNGFKQSSSEGVLDDWLVMCGTNAGVSKPGNIILDQDSIGSADGGSGSVCRLNIGYNEASDWALHSLIIWDYSLGTVPAPWHTSATLSQALCKWSFPCCDVGMRGTVFSGQDDWGRWYRWKQNREKAWALTQLKEARLTGEKPDSIRSTPLSCNLPLSGTTDMKRVTAALREVILPETHSDEQRLHGMRLVVSRLLHLQTAP
jgi:hypothetical protein